MFSKNRLFHLLEKVSIGSLLVLSTEIFILGLYAFQTKSIATAILQVSFSISTALLCFGNSQISDTPVFCSYWKAPVTPEL